MWVLSLPSRVAKGLLPSITEETLDMMSNFAFVCFVSASNLFLVDFQSVAVGHVEL